jgi:hypothetical protein
VRQERKRNWRKMKGIERMMEKGVNQRKTEGRAITGTKNNSHNLQKIKEEAKPNKER